MISVTMTFFSLVIVLNFNVGRIFLMCTEDIFYNKGTIHHSYCQKVMKMPPPVKHITLSLQWECWLDEQQMQASHCNIEYQYHHPIISVILWWWWLSGIFLTGITSARLTTTPAVEQTSITSFQRSTIITEHWTIHIFFIVFNNDTITINHLWHHHHYHENSSWTIHILFIIINDDNNPIISTMVINTTIIMMMTMICRWNVCNCAHQNGSPAMSNDVRNWGNAEIVQTNRFSTCKYYPFWSYFESAEIVQRDWFSFEST